MSVPADTTSPAAATTQSILVGLFRGYMELAKDQCVVYNQKWKIPPDKRLYMMIASTGPVKQYGATAALRNSDDGLELYEDVAVASREMMTVEIYSRSQEAVERKEEVMMALASTQAQQLCEHWALKLARIPLTFVDVSAVEGTARLNRFSLTFALLRTRTKSTLIESYNQFQKPALVINP